MNKTNQKKSPVFAVADRTSAGLRSALFDELDGLRDGTINATRANAVAKLATTIVETVRMELDVAKYAERNKLTSASAAKRLNTAVNLAA